MWANASCVAGDNLASIAAALFEGKAETHTRSAAFLVLNSRAPALMAGNRLPRTQASPTAVPTAIAITDVRFGSRSRLAKATLAGPRCIGRTRPSNRRAPGVNWPTARKTQTVVANKPSSARSGCHAASAPCRLPAHVAIKPRPAMSRSTTPCR